jgi:hypothetical protein
MRSADAADGALAVPGVSQPPSHPCATCGLAAPASRTYCTGTCRLMQHRYSRALGRVPTLTAAAMESEDLDRPEFALREWALVQAAIDRLSVMHERIRAARQAAGLDVPDDWP